MYENEYFKNLIDDASSNQDIHTNFSALLYEQILLLIEEDEENFIENLRDLILKELNLW